MPAAAHRPLPVSRRVVAGLLALAGISAIGAQSAGAASYVYWSNSGTGTIGRAALDGSGVDQDIVSGLTFPMGVAVDQGHLYWADEAAGRIGRADLDGSGADHGFIPTTFNGSDLAVDAGHLYWTARAAHTIGRADTTGANVNPFFAQANFLLQGVAVDDGHIYWTNVATDHIGRADLDGQNVELQFMHPRPGAWGLAIADGHIYWADRANNSIGRANLDGSGADPDFITGASEPIYMTAAGGHIYWANFTDDTIGRARTDGTGVEHSFVTGAANPTDVAVLISEPAASLAPASAAYGDQVEGTTSPARSFTIANTGTAPTAIGAAALTGSGASQFRLTPGTCAGATLAVGATCSVAVSFVPGSAGAATATLSVASDDPLSPATAALSGTGVSAAPAPAPAPPATPATPPAPPATPVVAPRAGQSPTSPAVAHIAVAVSGPGTLRTTATARIGRRTVRLPAAVRTVSGAGTVSVRLTLPPPVRARLAATGRIRIAVAGVLTDPAGARTATSAAATLTAPPSRVLTGHWIGRVLGPWRHTPAMSSAARGAVRFAPGPAGRSARVLR